MRWVRAALALCLMAVTAPATARTLEARQDFGRADAAATVLVQSTTDIALLRPVLEAFARAHPDIAIVYEQWGSNDLYEMNAEACRDGTAAADLVINSAVDQQVRLVNDGCARTHASAVPVDPAANWRNELYGITLEPAAIVYNREFVSPEEAPRTRFDIIDLLRPVDSRFSGRVATYDIQASGLGYLLAFADSLQATTFGSLIEAFARSGAVATCCSAEIIDGVVSGRYLLAYNVLGSYARARAQTAPNLVVVAPSDYTLVLRRAALIPTGALDPAVAGVLLDFLLSPVGQRLLADAHLVLDPSDTGPAGLTVPLDTHAAVREIPLSPVLLVGLDQQKRAAFLDLWRSTFTSD
ncbi:MAG: ABC transporter substrate-binding protein [Acuticoccus sp.]